MTENWLNSNLQIPHKGWVARNRSRLTTRAAGSQSVTPIHVSTDSTEPKLTFETHCENLHAEQLA